MLRHNSRNVHAHEKKPNFFSTGNGVGRGQEIVGADMVEYREQLAGLLAWPFPSPGVGQIRRAHARPLFGKKQECTTRDRLFTLDTKSQELN